VTALAVQGLRKSFRLHLQGGTVIPVLEGLDLEVAAGECLVLNGPSGIGKSTVLKLVYGTYKADGGRILIEHEGRTVDLAAVGPRTILEVRRRTLGHVSQFLRAVPRVPAIEVVAEPLLIEGVPPDEALARAGALLRRLNLPEALLRLPPATFSGGEQQRVNIARGFVRHFPVLLLDEPTASLDAENRKIVIAMIEEARMRGTAILAICHDREVREAIATDLLDLQAAKALAA
jgi:alpha-D-ribose 1-methylphosphonate 5-triphosphate synthase subunit PhnL